MKGTGWFDTWVTKKSVLVVATMFVAAGYFLEIKDASAGCDAGWCLKHSADVLLTLFYPSVVLVIFTSLTYLLRNEVFKTWIKFGVGWATFSVIWVGLTPHQPGADWIGIDPKPLLALSLSVIFFSLSALIVLIKSVQIYWFKK